MGREIVYCDVCGERLLESQFTKNEAVTLFNKNYCTNCKGEAVQNLAPGDVPAAAAAKPKAPAPASAKRKSSPRLSAVPPKTRSRPSPASQEPASDRKWILVGGGIGLILILILVILVVTAPGTPTSPGGNPGNGNAGGGGRRNGGSNKDKPIDPQQAKEAQAEKAYDTCRKHWEKNQSDPSTVLQFIRQRIQHVKGTSFEAKLTELQYEVKQWDMGSKARQQVRNAIRDAELAINKDVEFDQYGRIMTALRQARSLARQNELVDMVAEIHAIANPYEEKYEAAARKEYEALYRLARNQGADGNYDNAIRVIDQFPAHLRHSKAWKELENLKKQYQKEKK